VSLEDSDNVKIDHIVNSRIVENVHISSKVTSDFVDEIVKTNIPTLDETRVHKENFGDVQDALVECSILIPDGIDVSEDNTSDSEHLSLESSMPIQVARYSFDIPMIENEIEIRTIDSVVISSKLSKFSRAGCAYVVASNFSSSESMKFFIVVHHDTSSVSSFSEYLELFSDFSHIPVDLSDVISLAVSDVCPSLLENQYISLS